MEGDPLTIPETFYHAVTGMDNCAPLSNEQIQKFRDKLTPQAIESQSSYHYATTYTRDAMTERRADTYDLHLSDHTNETLNAMVLSSPDSALQTANDFTMSEYGFKLTNASPDLAQSTRDAMNLIGEFHTIPVEVVRAVTKNDLNEVIIGDTTGLSETAGADYNGANKQIRMKPGATWALGHEFLGHAVAYADSAKHCVIQNTDVPSIDNANPPEFHYTDDPHNVPANGWQEYTVSGYAATEDYEDLAETAGVISGTNPDTESDQILDGSSVIKEKAAVTLATIDDLVPNAGSYYADQLIANR
jgi:hypothetical protein